MKVITVNHRLKRDSIAGEVLHLEGACVYTHVIERRKLACISETVLPGRIPAGVLMEKGCLDQGVTSEAVRAELERILASPEFKSSKRCQDFLDFVVARSLAGLADDLKERTVGIEVFGRPPSYDTSTDGIVRINASEVRKRLAIFYADPARYSECRISLPTGAYVPQFSKPATTAPEAGIPRQPQPAVPGTAKANLAELTATPTRSQSSSRNTKFGRRIFVFAVAAILAAAALSVRWLGARHRQTIVDEFWQPMFQGKTPIMIVPAYVPTYDPETNPPNGRFTLMTDQYVGGGDLVAAVQVSSMLVRLGYPFNLRMGAGVSLDDLRNTPTVLIGYSSTQWKDVTKKFRFFVDDSSNGMIRDNGKPTDWYPHHETPEHHTDEDYAVISRAFDPETRSMLILVSGCMQYGTEGAARLITNPDLLAPSLRSAPKDWQQKNLQLVIQFDVVANSPASSRVVASYYW